MASVPMSGPSSLQQKRPDTGRGTRSERRSCAHLAGLVALLAGLGEGCSFDWNAYDPRLGSSSSGDSSGPGPGGGGTGGLSSSSTGDPGGSGGTTGTGATGGIGGTGGTGATGGGGAAPCGGTNLLSDNFDDGPAGVPWTWVIDPIPGAIVAESNGEGTVALPAAAGLVYGAFQTKRYYNLSNDAVAVKVTNVADAATASTFLLARLDDQNYIEISQKNGLLSFVSVVGGMTTVIAQTSYDAMKHRFWRLREDSGTTYWETLDDNLSPTKSNALPTSQVFDLSTVRIDLGGRLEGGAASTSEARFDDVNGGGPPLGKWCPASTLKDDFADGVPGRSWLRSSLGQAGSCTLTEEEGALAFKAPAGQSSYCNYYSSSSYDLTDSSLVIEVPEIMPPTTTAEVFVRLDVEGESTLEMTQTNGQLLLRKNTNGTVEIFGAIQYKPGMPDTPRWWRIHEQGGTTFWDYSADGSSWIPGTSLPNPLTLTAVDILVGGGTYGANGVAVPVDAHFNSLNMAP